MQFLLDGLAEAWHLVAGGDPKVLHAIYVTLLCTVSAVTLAAVLGIPYGAWLGRHRRDGRGIQVFLMRVGMFAPTVVVGLFVYGFLTRYGILGQLDLLYTKTAIVIGEFLLAFPIIVTLVHGTTAAQSRRVGETARTLGGGRLRVLFAVLGEARVGLVAACLVAAARCLSELGIVLLVGGNFEVSTRTLSSTIAVEIRRGEFSRGLACGIILLVLAAGVALFGHRLGREAKT